MGREDASALNKTFVVTFKEGKCELDSGMTPQFHMKMSIGTFTTLLMGYKTAEKLLHMGKIEATADAAGKLDDILYQEIPYVSDYI